MTWKPKKKPKPLSREEQVYVQEKLNAYKKFFKPLKGEIIYKVEGSSQEVVATARYYTEDDIKKDAEEIVARMNELSKGEKKWVLVSAKSIGREELDHEEDASK